MKKIFFVVKIIISFHENNLNETWWLLLVVARYCAFSVSLMF